MKFVELIADKECRNKLRTIPMLFAVITTGVCWLLITMWLTISFNILPYAMSYSAGSIMPAEAVAGNYVSISRDVVVAREVTYTVTRSVVRVTDGNPIIYNIEPVTITYPKSGYYQQTRILQLPVDIAVGDYLLTNTACYTEFHLFERCVQTPQLPIRIIKDTEAK